MRFEPYCINANIRAAALRKITDFINNVLFFEIDSLRSSGSFRCRQSIWQAIYSDHPTRPPKPSDFLRHEANWTTAKDSDSLTALHSSPIDRSPTSRKNIGQKQDFFIFESIVDDTRTEVCIRDAHKLSLATLVTAIQIGITEQATSFLV